MSFLRRESEFRMELGDDKQPAKTWLVFESRAIWNGRGHIRYWVEKDQVVTIQPYPPPRRPRRELPAVETRSYKVPGSERETDAWDACSSMLMVALSRGHIVDKSAEEAVHALFWEILVMRDEGLKYIGKYSAQSGEFYTRCRADCFMTAHKEQYEGLRVIEKSFRVGDSRTIEDDMYDVWDGLTAWQKLEFYRRVVADVDVNDALVAAWEMGSNGNHSEFAKFVALITKTANDKPSRRARSS